jgi:alanine racemase
LETLPDAVARNVAIAQARTRARIMAVVKADGYGHGACTVAQAVVAAGAEWLGTTDIAEASELRAAGLIVPILTWLNPSGVDAEAAAAGRSTSQSAPSTNWRPCSGTPPPAFEST